MSFSLGGDPSELLLPIGQRWPWRTIRSIRGTVPLRHSRLTWQWRLPWCCPILRAPNHLSHWRGVQAVQCILHCAIRKEKVIPPKGIKLVRVREGIIKTCYETRTLSQQDKTMTGLIRDLTMAYRHGSQDSKTNVNNIYSKTVNNFNNLIFSNPYGY